MNVTSLSRGVPVSSQPFLVLDRNLIVIMKHYSHSSVKSPAFVFGTSRDNCLPFESILHNPHNNVLLRDHLLRIITWALSDSQRCGGLALLRAADKLMGKQPLLLNILSEGSETCVVRREVLHHPTQQPRHIRATAAAQPWQCRVLWRWSRGAQRQERLPWAPKEPIYTFL